MARPVKGDVVVLPFPFSDLTASKRRPALVLASLLGNDLILAQITSRFHQDGYSVEIHDCDFERGSLRQVSAVRPNRIFTADQQIVVYTAGHLRAEATDAVVERLIRILKN